MRRIAVVSLVTLAACGSSPRGGPEAGPAVQTVRVTQGTAAVAQLSTSPTAGPVALAVPHSVDAVWRALPAVYETLGIPVAELNPTTRTIGNQGFRIRRRMGNVPLSRYLECGAPQGTPNADVYEITMTVSTRVQQVSPDASTVSTTLQATARNPNFSSDPFRCATKGALELRIAEALRSQLAQ